MEKSAGFASGFFARQSKQSRSLDKRKCSGKNLLLPASLRDQKQLWRRCVSIRTSWNCIACFRYFPWSRHHTVKCYISSDQILFLNLIPFDVGNKRHIRRLRCSTNIHRENDKTLSPRVVVLFELREINDCNDMREHEQFITSSPTQRTAHTLYRSTSLVYAIKDNPRCGSYFWTKRNETKITMTRTFSRLSCSRCSTRVPIWTKPMILMKFEIANSILIDLRFVIDLRSAWKWCRYLQAEWSLEKSNHSRSATSERSRMNMALLCRWWILRLWI